MNHTSAEFAAFLTDIVVSQPKNNEIHVIADNLSAHKTKRVEEFLTSIRTCVFISSPLTPLG